MSSSPSACSHRCRMPRPCRLPLPSRTDHNINATLPTPRAQKLGRKDQRARVPRMPISTLLHCSSKRDLRPRRARRPILLSLDHPTLHTRPQLFLTSSSPLQPLSSARARVCLSPRACKASRITPAVTKIKKPRQRQPALPNITGTNPMGRSARIVSDAGLTRAGGSHLRPVETTHRPLCGRLRQLHNRAMMTVFAPSVAHLPSGPSPGN